MTEQRKLSLLAQAVDDAFALPGSYGTLAVARRAWNEYKAALAASGSEPTRVTDEMVDTAYDAFSFDIQRQTADNKQRNGWGHASQPKAMRAALEALFRAPSREHRCECQPPYHRAGCIWSAPKEQVTACFDSSLCECGRKHARPWCVTHDAPLLCSSGGHNCAKPPAFPSREEIAKALLPGHYDESDYAVALEDADAVLALIADKR